MREEASDERLHRLEHSLLELGTEVFRIRNELYQVRDQYDHVVAMIQGLKGILDDKGLICGDDFDNAVPLGQAVGPAHEPGFEDELERIKKTCH